MPRRRSLNPNSTTNRGYGITHTKERLKWKTVVESGWARCTRCGQPIHPDAEWDLDHSDDRTHYLGAAHRGHNRSAGARKGNRIAQARRATTWTSRTW